mmetsp:Transcript_4846/g.4042  ORF Transcript_4846/g.4042 Transcript_4846/m.4042 type:complete len:142 (-) Transcript_4846:59-484(-)
MREDDENEPERMESDEIKWKEGKDFTKKIVKKKRRNKKAGTHKMVEKVEEEESFFHLFKTIGSTGNKNDEDDEKDEAQVSEMERLDWCFELAAQLENEIVPFHLDYYLGIREECGDDHLGDADESAQEKMMKALQKKFGKV